MSTRGIARPVWWEDSCDGTRRYLPRWTHLCISSLLGECMRAMHIHMCTGMSLACRMSCRTAPCIRDLWHDMCMCSWGLHAQTCLHTKWRHARAPLHSSKKHSRHACTHLGAHMCMYMWRVSPVTASVYSWSAPWAAACSMHLTNGTACTCGCANGSDM